MKELRIVMLEKALVLVSVRFVVSYMSQENENWLTVVWKKIPV